MYKIQKPLLYKKDNIIHLINYAHNILCRLSKNYQHAGG